MLYGVYFIRCLNCLMLYKHNYKHALFLKPTCERRIFTIKFYSGGIGICSPWTASWNSRSVTRAWERRQPQSAVTGAINRELFSTVQYPNKKKDPTNGKTNATLVPSVSLTPVYCNAVMWFKRANVNHINTSC